MIDDSRPKAGSTFDSAILQACAPRTFSRIRALPAQRHKDSLDSPHFSGFCLDWLRIVNTSHAKGVITQRDVEPQAMLILPPVWYLVAWDPARQDFRHFRMDRISAPECVEGTSFRRRRVPFESDVRPLQPASA